MPERAFNTEFWSKPFVQDLPKDGKLLYTYLKTNSHCNQAGLYVITLATIAFDTGLAAADLPSQLSSLKPKVEWYPEDNLVWVKDFLQEQAKSPKFIAAALACIKIDQVSDELSTEFHMYNEQLLQSANIQPPISLTKRECVIIRDKFCCQYCHKELKSAADYEMDHIIPKISGGKDNYLNLAASCRDCNQAKLDKDPQEAGLAPPRVSSFHASQALFILKNNPKIREKWLSFFPERGGEVELILNNIEQHQSILTQDTPLSASSSSTLSKSKKGVEVVKGKGELSSEEKEIIQRIVKLKGWQADEDDVPWLQGLRSEFPGFTLAELKACVDYYSGRAPPKHKGIWKNRFRNWMIKKREFEGKQRPGKLPTTKELEEGWE
ncbi:hypothetical protein ES703_110486 [subsurface metagenome]